MARYEIVRSLGAGAAGGVYLVKDRVLGGAQLALKRVEASSHPSFRDSFAREFAVLASLSLPGVARVFDLGVAAPSEGDPGGPFFTRAFVDGEPLDRHAAGRSTAEQLQLMIRVLDTVGPLHELGVVHGDIKPANVIVDAQGAPHLIDFGLATAQSDAQRNKLAGSGTPAYMAPELFKGAAPSRACDLYALGATLWFILTGLVPFEELGEGALRAKLDGKLPQLPEGASGARAQALEAALWALQPDPRERPVRADELAARLQSALGGKKPASRSTRPGGFVAPRPRGRDALQADLIDAVQDLRVGRDEPAPRLLIAARGLGKTTVLHELKWRLQLASAPVIEVRCSGGGLAPFEQLLRQVMVYAPESAETIQRLLERVQQGDADAEALKQGTQQALSAACAQGTCVVLVDDLHRAEPSVGEALRLAVHADGALRPVVVATAEDSDAPAVQQLAAPRSTTLAPLSEDDVRALAGEALGPVDPAAMDTLVEHAAGNPGVLVEALAVLRERGAITEADVRALPRGEVGGRVARARLNGLPLHAHGMLVALAVAGGGLEQQALVDGFGDEGALDALEQAGLVLRHESSISLLDRGLAEWLARSDGEWTADKAAVALLEKSADALDVVARARLAVAAGDAQTITQCAVPAAKRLVALGADRAAVTLYEAFLKNAEGEDARAVHLDVADLLNGSGDHDGAVQHSEVVLSDKQSSVVERSRACVAAGKAYLLGGRLKEAQEVLGAVDEAAPAATRAEAACELARMHLRTNAYAEVREAAQRGLDAADNNDPRRSELIAVDGLAMSFGYGDHVRALERVEEALAVARKVGQPRDEAQALGYLANVHERSGDLERARAGFARCLDAWREVGDIGRMATYAMNTANMNYWLGDVGSSASQYTVASQLARRAGKNATAVLSDLNLANAQVYMGLYQRARTQVEQARSEADQMGLQVYVALGDQVMGEILERTGDTEGALRLLESAVTLFRKNSRRREQAEVEMGIAEVLLDRGGAADPSAAAARLAQARDLIDADSMDDHRSRLRLLLARARGATGDPEGAVRDLAELEQHVRDQGDRELLWQTLSVAADMHIELGAELTAAGNARGAAEVLESIATSLPRETRDAFRNDPRRRRTLDRARSFERGGGGRTGFAVQTTAITDQRASRLLEIIKRMAREHDLDRLLERITDSAVELSGAERGFVLLTDDDGQLQPRTMRRREGRAEDPHAAFSQSIAEAVLIDGEPIVTVDARDDRRLNEYMSVHKLMLKSVACLPINSHEGTVGVLYLEHRLRKGRFEEADMDVVFAFADQAAIALENARLYQENQARQRELEEANQQLAQAKADIERVLAARTEELEVAKADLDRAHQQLSGGTRRHGIVGQSAPMRQVFAVIERVQNTNVPVVIQGESGTGKELVARAIHFGGARRKANFVAVNCAALPEHLLESELFGHVKGAFTGADRDRKGLLEQAHGGTLFLDEMGDMPMRMQVDLLRALQEGKVRPVGADREVDVDVRVVAASNRSLQRLIADGKLREDLYYRLSVVEIRLPSLRDRPDDIPLLCDHFLKRMAKQHDAPPRTLSREAMERIVASGLPGNVRQLEHLLLSAWVMGSGPVIQPDELPLDGPIAPRVPLDPIPVAAVPVADAPVAPSPSAASGGAAQPVAKPPPGDLESFRADEKQRILEALQSNGWNRAQAAKALGMPRRTFYRRLKQHGVL